MSEENKIKITTFQESMDTLVSGIINAYKECPDSQNKTFEEVADWAGKRVVLTEKKSDE